MTKGKTCLAVFVLAMVAIMLCGERLPMAIDDNVYEMLMKGLAGEKVEMAKKNSPPAMRILR